MPAAFNRLLRSAALLLIAAAPLSCGTQYEVFLVGNVYDGATGARLPSYEMTLEYRDQTSKAQVSADGRFLMKLPVFQDYTVTITAPGYRPFRSHNAGFNIPNPESSLASAQGNQTLYFDSYLFPTDLVTPALSLSVRKGSSTGELASGKVRIRPISLSSLADTSQELPSGVSGQLWLNDEDMQAKPISRSFQAAPIQVEAAELVYGVRYLINIYDVAGYQPLEANFTAGTDGSRTLTLAEETVDPLTVVGSSLANCRAPMTPSDTVSAQFYLEFNQDVELAPTTLPGGFAEQVDNAFFINSPDTDVDGMRNVLAPGASQTVQEHGTRIEPIVNKRLTFTWNPNVGLASKDPQDVISVTWNVSSVQVQPVGRAQPKSLGTLFAQSFNITCQ